MQLQLITRVKAAKLTTPPTQPLYKQKSLLVRFVISPLIHFFISVYVITIMTIPVMFFSGIVLGTGIGDPRSQLDPEIIHITQQLDIISTIFFYVVAIVAAGIAISMQLYSKSKVINFIISFALIILPYLLTQDTRNILMGRHNTERNRETCEKVLHRNDCPQLYR